MTHYTILTTKQQILILKTAVWPLCQLRQIKTAKIIIKGDITQHHVDIPAQW